MKPKPVIFFFVLVMIAACDTTLVETRRVLSDDVSASKAAVVTQQKVAMHVHSTWSPDARHYPEMVALRHKDAGYNALITTEHARGQFVGDRWMSLSLNPFGSEALAEYQATFPELAMIKVESGDTLVLQSPTAKYRNYLETNEFIIIDGAELGYGGPGYHINAFGLTEDIPAGVIPPGLTLMEGFDFMQNLIEAQGGLAQLNHPTWVPLTEDQIFDSNVTLMEVYNGSIYVSNEGVEEMWSSLNARRVFEGLDPICVTATDDLHNYWGHPASRLGRGWVGVWTDVLSRDSLLAAIERCDFYASTGVEIEAVSRTIVRYKVKINATWSATYTTKFYGVMPGSDDYELLGTTTAIPAKYIFPPGTQPLRIWAIVTSSEEMDDPTYPGEPKKAWTQPL